MQAKYSNCGTGHRPVKIPNCGTGLRPVRARFRRRAAVIVQVAVMSTVIMGFGALAIDLGTHYSARGELQRAADSAALAGASCFFTNAGLTDDTDLLVGTAVTRAQAFSYVNPTLGEETFLDADDVLVGTLDLDDFAAVLDTSGLQRFNAVQAVARRTPGSANGPVDYLFAKIFGQHEGGVIASATAAVDDRFAGYEETEEYGLLLPFTVHRDVYEEMFASGPDEWSFQDGQPNQCSDYVREVQLYPWMDFNGNGNVNGGGDGNEGSGNFGLLNIGTNNHGVPYIENQIRNGIAPEELEAEIGTSQIMFYDEYGNPVTHEITGTPGLKAGMQDAVVERIGDIIAFFIHDDIWDHGANTTYRIVDVRFARVMYIDLHGNPENKQLMVQPVAYTGPGVIVRHYADSSGGQVGSLRLVR